MLYTASIANLDLFKIKDDTTDKIFIGCNQEWFSDERQRLSGCGPTTAAMLVHYYLYVKNKPNKVPCIKSSMLSLMEELWKYVTPGNRVFQLLKYFVKNLKHI